MDPDLHLLRPHGQREVPEPTSGVEPPSFPITKRALFHKSYIGKSLELGDQKHHARNREPSGSPLDVSRDRLSSPGRAKLRGDRTLPHEVLLNAEHSFSFAPAGVGPALTRFKAGLATYDAIETKQLQG